MMYVEYETLQATILKYRKKTNGLVEFRWMKAAEDSFQQVSGPWQRCDSPARRHSLEPVPDNFFFLSSGHLPAETNLQNTRGLAA